MKSTKWFISKEKGYTFITRNTYSDGKQKREYYPTSEYRHITDKFELKRFVLRLNNIDIKKLIAEENFNIRNAFFNEQDLEGFKNAHGAFGPTSKYVSYLKFPDRTSILNFIN